MQLLHILRCVSKFSCRCPGLPIRPRPAQTLGPRIQFMYHQIPPPITTTARMIQIHGMSRPVPVGVVCASVGEMARSSRSDLRAFAASQPSYASGGSLRAPPA